MITYLFKKYYHILIGLLAFTVYFLTTGRSIGEIDSGELAAVQATGGIAHPTGYPLFTILGYIYSKIPIVQPLIFQLNLFQAILNSFTIIILVKIIELLLANFSYLVDSQRHTFLINLRFSESTIYLSSILGGLIFAFSITFWKQATKVEVYSLQIFLTSSIIFSLLRVLIKYFKTEQIRNSEWYSVSVLIGLAFSNHMMTIYLLPALIYLFFFINKLNKKTFLLFSRLFFTSFSIAFFFYLLMMFRAQSGPEYSFMNEPRSFGALIDYVSGKYYKDYMFQGISTIKKQSLQFLKILSFDKETGFTGGEFGFFIILVFSGFIFLMLFLKQLRLFYFLMITTSLFFALNYSIPDIDEYFLVIFLLFTTSGAIFIAIIIQLTKAYKLVFLSSFIGLVGLQIYNNYREIDKSNEFVVEDYARGVIGQLPFNSILLTSDWPLLASPSYFLQYALGYRKDVEILGIELLPLPSYKSDIKKKYGSAKNLLKEDYFITFDVFKDYIRKNKFNLKNKTLVPEGLCFRVTSDTNYSNKYSLPSKIRFQYKRNIYQEYLYQLTGFMIETRARYELEHNFDQKARNLLNILKTQYSDYKINLNLE